jgi:hypothetical protein
VDPRAGLDDVEKRKYLTLPGLELRPLGRPACSQSLYRLRYPFFYMQRVAANILNKQSRTSEKELSSSLGVGRGTKNSSP